MNILFLLILISNNLFSPPDSLVQLFRSPSYWKSYNEVYSLDVSEINSKCPFALVEKNRHNLSTGENTNVFTLKFPNNVQAIWDEKAQYTGVYDKKADSFSVYDSQGKKLTAFPIKPLIKKYISYDKLESFYCVCITDKKILFYLHLKKPIFKEKRVIPLSPMPSFVVNIDWKNTEITRFIDYKSKKYSFLVPRTTGNHAVFTSKMFFIDIYDINESKFNRIYDLKVLPNVFTLKSIENKLFITLLARNENTSTKFKPYLFVVDCKQKKYRKVLANVFNFQINNKYILTQMNQDIKLFRRIDLKPIMEEKTKTFSDKTIGQNIFLFPYGDRILVIDDRTKKPTVIKIVE